VSASRGPPGLFSNMLAGASKIDKVRRRGRARRRRAPGAAKRANQFGGPQRAPRRRRRRRARANRRALTFPHSIDARAAV